MTVRYDDDRKAWIVDSVTEISGTIFNNLLKCGRRHKVLPLTSKGFRLQLLEKTARLAKCKRSLAAVCIIFSGCIAQSTISSADEQFSTECARKIADIIRIIEKEFSRGPRTWEEPYFFGLLTYTYQSYSVLEENERKVEGSVPIYDCTEADLYESVSSTKLKPNPFFRNGTSIVVSFETEHKSAQFAFDTINKNIRGAILRVKKSLME